jgi:hypothetical protein
VYVSQALTVVKELLIAVSRIVGGLMSETYTYTVSGRRMRLSGAEIKVLDPPDPASGSGSAELSDACT